MRSITDRNTITGIRLQNYKAFRDTGWIDFNRFTLFYGDSSTGKSIILKFLYQLKLCISAGKIGRNVTLWNDEPESQEGGFLDLLHNGKDNKNSEMVFSFKLSLNEEENRYVHSALSEFAGVEAEGMAESLTYSVSYKYMQSRKRIELRSVLIKYGEFVIYHFIATRGGKFMIETDISQFAWNSKYPLPSYFDIRNTFILEEKSKREYKTTLSEDDINAAVMPAQRFVAQFMNHLQMVINQTLIDYTDDFEYFYPSRYVPNRIMQLNLQDTNRVGASGENTYNVLFALEINKDTKTKAAINKYLKLFGYEYEWRLSKGRYGEFLLVDLKTKTKVNILDCGFGISQILPIIVSCFGDSSEALAIDSPDAHLHSRVHGEICDLLIETSRHRNVIVETHSENILLRLQRRIVEKNDILPDSATVYYITDTEDETVCKKITFNEYGDMVNEPDEFKNFFSASFEDVMSITKAKGIRMRENHADCN